MIGVLAVWFEHLLMQIYGWRREREGLLLLLFVFKYYNQLSWEWWQLFWQSVLLATLCHHDVTSQYDVTIFTQNMYNYLIKLLEISTFKKKKIVFFQ